MYNYQRAAYCSTLRFYERLFLLDHSVLLVCTCMITLGHTLQYLQFFLREFLELIEYCPDMAPKDFHVFRFEADFGCFKFKDNREMETEVASWLVKQVMMFCQHGMSNCVSGYDTCHKYEEKYVESRAIAVKLTVNSTNFAGESRMFSLLTAICVFLRYDIWKLTRCQYFLYEHWQERYTFSNLTSFLQDMRICSTKKSCWK